VTTLPTSAPALSTGWLLRTTAFVAVAAAIMGLVVSPGLHGNSGEAVVLWSDRTSAALSYFLVALLAGLVVRSTFELLRSEVPAGIRAPLMVGGTCVLAAMIWPVLRDGFRDRPVPQVTVLTASAAAAITLLAGAFLASRPHTRATAGVLFAFGLAAVVRVGAWVIATRASDHADMQLFGVSRALATAGVLLEAAGQLTAFMWLGTRSRAFGQLGSFAALAGAFVVTIGIARGVHSGAPLWQAVLHTSLADAPGIPPTYRLDALATFLVPASLLLALAVVAQPKQVAAITATMALALVSRGALDVPLRALCAVAAAHWAVLARVDEKAMWRALIDERHVRLAEDGGEDEGRGEGAGGENAPPRSPSA
jgi:hypothetical protein